MARTLEEVIARKQNPLLRLLVALGLREPFRIKPTPVAQHWQVGRSAVNVGRFTYGHGRTYVRQWKEGASLNIGSFCSVAEGVTVFLGGNHRTDWVSTYPFGNVAGEIFEVPRLDGHPSTRGDVTIGDDVWLGSGSVIMSGVTIGPGAVVAAHAVVHKDVEPYTIVGGNPAQPLRKRFDDDTIATLLADPWWDKDLEEIKRRIPELCAPPANNQSA